jgi:hypothetical protein
MVGGWLARTPIQRGGKIIQMNIDIRRAVLGSVISVAKKLDMTEIPEGAVLQSQGGRFEVESPRGRISRRGNRDALPGDNLSVHP